MESVDTPVELGRLLAGTLGAVARAQSELDAATAQRVEAYRQREPGSFAVPPLWHVFSNVEVTVALSVSVAQAREQGVLEPRIFSRTLNPKAVALYGYAASAGLAVRVSMQPLGAVPRVPRADAGANSDADAAAAGGRRRGSSQDDASTATAPLPLSAR